MSKPAIGDRIVLLPSLPTAYRYCEHSGEHGTVTAIAGDYQVKLDSGKILWFGPLRVVHEKK